MKKYFLFLVLPASLLISCGGKPNAEKLAEKICDCNKKVMKMEVSDPKRVDAQMDCSRESIAAITKLKDDKEKYDAFNKRLDACVLEK